MKLNGMDSRVSIAGEQGHPKRRRSCQSPLNRSIQI
jgi:hypothetical protein